MQARHSRPLRNALLVALAGWIITRVRTTPAERERRRRLFVNRVGRLADGMLTDISGNTLYYSYNIMGVEYAAAQEVADLNEAVDKRELNLALSGKHDAADAILAIHAGEGGTEAQDWVEMMLRMYLRWAERHGYKTTITDKTPGEEAGIKSVTVEVQGPWAYGYLKGEKGNHRLVRLSPFDSNNRRHTSFAQVEVLPVLDDDIEIEIHPNDIKVDVFLSGGAGGQSVQKNATAVRLTHLPTNLVVTCQNERSQTQNRETAMKVLRARLYDIEMHKKLEQEAEFRGAYVKAGFGTRIRNYVLHPYQMVKDERTGYETGNTGAVLDGDLDPFIDAWLKMQVGQP